MRIATIDEAEAKAQLGNLVEILMESASKRPSIPAATSVIPSIRKFSESTS
jgi:hypothetical protein